MLKFQFVLLIIMLMILSISCKGPMGEEGLDGTDGTDGSYDKEIRIPFPTSSALTYDSTWSTQRHAYALFDFNIENYIGVDSVIFSVATEMNNKDDTCFIRLYNSTDSVIINSSYMWSTNEELTRIHSQNIFSELPKKNIDIGISLRGHIPEYSNYVFARYPYLILYRNKE